MRLTIILATTLAILLAPTGGSAPDPVATGCTDEPSSEVLVYRAYTDEGVIADPSLALIAPPSTEPRPVNVSETDQITSVGGTCHALLFTKAGKQLVLDGGTGTVRSIELAPGSTLRPHASAGPWVLLTPEGRYDYTEMQLLNVETGELTPLVLDVDRYSTLIVQFSPSGQYLAVSYGTGGPLVVPTDDLSAARTVAGGDLASIVGFDRAERRVIVRDGSLSGPSRLIVQELETGASTVIAEQEQVAEDEPWLTGAFVPGSDDRVLVRYSDRLVVMGIEGSAATEETTLPGSFNVIRVARSGLGALVETYQERSLADPPERSELFYVDLTSGNMEAVAKSGSAPIQAAGGGSRWLVFARGDLEAPGELFAFDLDTGKSSALLTAGPDESFDLATIRTSADGRILTVTAAIPENRQRAYLANAETGSTSLLVEAGRVSSSVAPTGYWMAYSTLERTDAGLRMQLTLVQVETGQETDVAPGLDPVWLSDT